MFFISTVQYFVSWQVIEYDHFWPYLWPHQVGQKSGSKDKLCVCKAGVWEAGKKADEKARAGVQTFILKNALYLKLFGDFLTRFNPQRPRPPVLGKFFHGAASPFATVYLSLLFYLIELYTHKTVFFYLHTTGIFCLRVKKLCGRWFFPM